MKMKIMRSDNSLQSSWSLLKSCKPSKNHVVKTDNPDTNLKCGECRRSLSKCPIKMDKIEAVLINNLRVDFKMRFVDKSNVKQSFCDFANERLKARRKAQNSADNIFGEIVSEQVTPYRILESLEAEIDRETSPRRRKHLLKVLAMREKYAFV